MTAWCAFNVPPYKREINMLQVVIDDAIIALTAHDNYVVKYNSSFHQGPSGDMEAKYYLCDAPVAALWRRHTGLFNTGSTIFVLLCAEKNVWYTVVAYAVA